MSLRLRRQLSTEGARQEGSSHALTRLPSLTELTSAALSRRSSVASIDGGTPSSTGLARTPSLADIGARFASQQQKPSADDSSPLPSPASVPGEVPAETTPKPARTVSTATAGSPFTRRSVTPLVLPFGAMGQFSAPRSNAGTPPATPTRSLHQPSAPPTPGFQADRFPLQHEWTYFVDSKIGSTRGGRTVDGAVYQANLRAQGSCTTVEGFGRLWSDMTAPSRLDKDASMHLFKDGVRPAWEDPANAEGGRWIVSQPVRVPPAYIDECWLNLALATIGEQLDERDDLIGISWQSRKAQNRLQVWLRDRNDLEAVNGIGRRLAALAGLGRPGHPGETCSIEWLAHDRSKPGPHVSKIFRLDALVGPGGAVRRSVTMPRLSSSTSIPSLPTTPITPLFDTRPAAEQMPPPPVPIRVTKTTISQDVEPTPAPVAITPVKVMLEPGKPTSRPLTPTANGLVSPRPTQPSRQTIVHPTSPTTSTASLTDVENVQPSSPTTETTAPPLALRRLASSGSSNWRERERAKKAKLAEQAKLGLGVGGWSGDQPAIATVTATGA